MTVESLVIWNITYLENNYYKISSAKNVLKTPDKYLKEVAGDYRRETIGKIYEEYQSTLKKNNSLDFDDLLLLPIKLFKEIVAPSTTFTSTGINEFASRIKKSISIVPFSFS